MVGKVPGADKEYRCIVEMTSAEIEFDQVKITHNIARVSLDFYQDQGRIGSIKLARYKCKDHPTYHSHSHVAADRLTGRCINVCQDQTRELAGLHLKDATQLQ